MLISNRILFLVATFILFSSCGKDEVNRVIDAELLPYIQSFIEEGEKREVSDLTSELVANLVDKITVIESDACGVGVAPQFSDKEFPQIEIEQSCWEGLNDKEKEFLVFHELGHAVLSRAHTDLTLPDGYRYKSMMCTGCPLIKSYGEETILRDYYIDELFNPAIAFPYADKEFKKIEVEEDFSNGLDGWELYYNGILIEDWETYPRVDISKVNNGSSSSLTISSVESDDAWLQLIKRFEIDDLSECSNLLAYADFRAAATEESHLEVGLSLTERNINGELERFYINRHRVDQGFFGETTYRDFQVVNYCIPQKTEIATISFSIFSSSFAKISIDNVRIEVHE